MVDHAPHNAGQHAVNDDRPCMMNIFAPTPETSPSLRNSMAGGDDRVGKACDGYQCTGAGLGGQLLVPAHCCGKGRQADERGARQCASVGKCEAQGRIQRAQALAQKADGAAHENAHRQSSKEARAATRPFSACRCGFGFACAKLAFQFADEFLTALFRLCGILLEEGFLCEGIGVSDDAQFKEIVRRALCQKQDFRAILLGELFQNALGKDFPAGREADGDVSRFMGKEIVGLGLDADARERLPPRAAYNRIACFPPSVEIGAAFFFQGVYPPAEG